MDDNNLILTDADAMSSNRYAIRILGDVHDALNVTFRTLPINESEIVPYTAIITSEFARRLRRALTCHPSLSHVSVTVIFAKSTLLLKSPYRVTLQVQDETLLPEHGENTVSNGK